jgi:transposase InsO family protein
MQHHPDAVLTPRGRARVFEAVEAGMTVSAACLAFGVSRRFYYRWHPRWQAGRHGGLAERSCRPRSSPQRTAVTDEAVVVALRRLTGWGADRLGAWLGLPASTCHRVLRRQGLIAARRGREPVVRYEHESPGSLIHFDTKRLGRIVGGPGHRATGDRSGRRRGVGWEVMHVAIDDATRLVYAEILPDERKRTTTRFAIRALRWSRERGVRVWRVLTDNGSAYRSRVFRSALRRLGIKHSRTRPYRPQTNGKVERWIRTVLSECLYLEVFGSSEQRRLALDRFIRYYNGVRPHLGIGGRTPLGRLAEKQAA